MGSRVVLTPRAHSEEGWEGCAALMCSTDVLIATPSLMESVSCAVQAEDTVIPAYELWLWRVALE